jgi:hypothetical protein
MLFLFAWFSNYDYPMGKSGWFRLFNGVFFSAALQNTLVQISWFAHTICRPMAGWYGNVDFVV